MFKMFVGHLLSMGVVLIGFVVGVIIGLTSSWTAGIIVGLIIMAIGLISAGFNMARGVKKTTGIAGSFLEGVAEAVVEEATD